MNKSTVALLTFGGFLALSAVSCVDHAYDDPPKLSADIPVNEIKRVDSSVILDIVGDGVSTNDDGDFLYKKDGDGPLHANLPADDVKTVDGTIKVDLKEAPSIVTDPELIQPSLRVTLTNPSDKAVKLDCKVSVNGFSKMDLPSAEIAPGKTATVVYLPENQVDTPLVEGDIYTALPDECLKRLSSGLLSEIEFSDFKLDFHNSATVSLTASTIYEYKIEAAYCIPFSFRKGAKIKIVKEFKDIGFDLTPYTQVQKFKYFVKCKVTSSMPFEINATAKSNQGIVATMDNPILSGSPEVPVTTDVSVSISTENDKITVLDQAVVTAELTATVDNARLNTKQGLSIDVDTIQVVVN